MNQKHFAIAGLSSPIIFTLTYFIMSAQRTDYSFLTKAVSELGSVDAPNLWLWNIFGYILPGMLIAIFGYGLYQVMEANPKGKLPLISIVLSGVFMSIAGIFPGDFEDRTSLTMVLHSVGSFGSYIFFLLGAFTYPSLMKQSHHWEKAIRPSLIITWLTIVFGSWPFIFPEMPGIGQRIVFGLYFLWMAYLAMHLYQQKK